MSFALLVQMTGLGISVLNADIVMKGDFEIWNDGKDTAVNAIDSVVSKGSFNRVEPRLVWGFAGGLRPVDVVAVPLTLAENGEALEAAFWILSEEQFALGVPYSFNADRRLQFAALRVVERHVIDDCPDWLKNVVIRHRTGEAVVFNRLITREIDLHEIVLRNKYQNSVSVCSFDVLDHYTLLKGICLVLGISLHALVDRRDVIVLAKDSCATQAFLQTGLHRIVCRPDGTTRVDAATKENRRKQRDKGEAERESRRHWIILSVLFTCWKFESDADPIRDPPRTRRISTRVRASQRHAVAPRGR